MRSNAFLHRGCLWCLSVSWLLTTSFGTLGVKDVILRHLCMVWNNSSGGIGQQEPNSHESSPDWKMAQQHLQLPGLMVASTRIPGQPRHQPRHRIVMLWDRAALLVRTGARSAALCCGTPFRASARLDHRSKSLSCPRVETSRLLCSPQFNACDEM